MYMGEGEFKIFLPHTWTTPLYIFLYFREIWGYFIYLLIIYEVVKRMWFWILAPFTKTQFHHFGGKNCMLFSKSVFLAKIKYGILHKTT